VLDLERFALGLGQDRMRPAYLGLDLAHDSDTTTSQCRRLHGRRSSRAGMSVMTVLPVPPATRSCLSATLALTLLTSRALPRKNNVAGRLSARGGAVEFRYTPPARGAP
jgi:hypothetical protein